MIYFQDDSLENPARNMHKERQERKNPLMVTACHTVLGRQSIISLICDTCRMAIYNIYNI